MTFWKCKICGLTTYNEAERHDHLIKTNDTAHQKIIKQKAGNKSVNVNEEVEDSWEIIKKRIKNIL